MSNTIKLNQEKMKGLIFINDDVEEIKDKKEDKVIISEPKVNIPQPKNAWVNLNKNNNNPKITVNNKRRNKIDVIENFEENVSSIRPSTSIPTNKVIENKLKQKLNQNSLHNNKFEYKITGYKKTSEIKQKAKPNQPSDKAIKISKINHRATTQGGKKIINLPFESSLDLEFLSLFAAN